MRDNGKQAGSADEIAEKSREDEAAGRGDGCGLPGQHHQPGFRRTCDHVAEPAEGDRVSDDEDESKLAAACVR